MIDAKIRFFDDSIRYNGYSFSYTEPLLQRHYKAVEFMARPFDTYSNEEIYSLMGVKLNYIEQMIVDYATVYEYDNLDEYLFSDFYYIATDYDLDESFYNSVLDMAKEGYYMAVEYNGDKEYINMTRLIVDVIEYRAKKYDIYDMLCCDWEEDDFILDIISEEYKHNPLYSMIDEEKIMKCLEYYHFYILDNVLHKDVLKKKKKKERKRLLNVLSCKDNIEKLKKHYNFKPRIYDTNKVLNRKNKSSDKKNIEVCYILKNKRNGLYKIGYSSNPSLRESTLQSQEPEIERIKVFKNNHENLLHEKYKKQRVRGEWFNLTNLQVKYICTHFE